MPTLTLKPVPYVPTSPLAGDEAAAIFRGQNIVLKGTPPQMYYEAYPGSENLSEPVPAFSLTGTLSFDPSSPTVTGTATAFLDELHIGQKILADGGEVLSVLSIESDTSFTNGRLPVLTAVGETATIPRRLFPLDVRRGTLVWGNAVQFDRGTIVAVGSGELYVNGAVMPGTGLTAERKAVIAVYDATTGNYTAQDLSFDTTPDAADISVTILGSGGSKNMSLGYYSHRFAYYSDTTTGYSNPSDVKLGAANAPFQLTAANSRWQVDFSADSGNRPANADGYIVYTTSYGNSSAQSAVNAIQGAWYESKRVKFSDLDPGDILIFEVVDADMSGVPTVSFDNGQIPDAEFIATLDNYLVAVSTNGKGVGSGARSTETSPGAFVSPMKAENASGYPPTLKVPTEKGETIIGFTAAAGRIFVMTANTLQAVSSTGLPSAPLVCRPFWRRGFASPDTLVFVNDTLYGFTTRGPYRSIATGDASEAANDFATEVSSVMASWSPSYVLLGTDSTAEQVCFVYSASRQNANGWWESDILPYSLRHNSWMPPIILSDDTRDMIVSSVAEVNGYLEFIAGGRRDGLADQWDTWRYNTGSGVEVPCYMAWQFTDNGAELIAKIIRKLRLKGSFKNGVTASVYAVLPDSDIDVDALEDGTGAAFTVSLAATTGVEQYAVTKCRVHNAMMWTVRLEFTADWSGDVAELRDQVHEAAIVLDVSGQER